MRFAPILTPRSTERPRGCSRPSISFGSVDVWTGCARPFSGLLLHFLVRLEGPVPAVETEGHDEEKEPETDPSPFATRTHGGCCGHAAHLLTAATNTWWEQRAESHPVPNTEGQRKKNR